MKITDRYDNFCIDLDGVMWNGNNSVPGSVEAIRFLKSNQKNIIFVTNNASLTRSELEEKFRKMGFDTDSGSLYTTGYAITKYLKINHPNLKKIAVLGMPGLRQNLKSEGYEVIYPPELVNSINNLKDFDDFDVDREVEAVITAYDVKTDYFSLLYCSACLQNGADFIALNRDRFFIYCNNIIPASGCTLKFMETATSKKPKTIGKPQPFMFDLIAEEHGLDRKRTVMIGDSMESDILFGINSGIDTFLVLSGVTNQVDIEKFEYRPTEVIQCLGSIIG